jgi:spermidine synthase
LFFRIHHRIKELFTRNKNDFRLYLNNNLQFSSADEYRYHEALVHPAFSMAKNIENVLILEAVMV